MDIGIICGLISISIIIIQLIGKAITIILKKDLNYEQIKIYYNNDEPKNIKIIDEVQLEDVAKGYMIFSTERYINNFKIYECKYNEEKNDIEKSKLIYEYKGLKKDFGIKIYTIFSISIPRYIIEFENYDYLKGTFVISENGNNGIIEEFIEMKHTLKSILYYIFK